MVDMSQGDDVGIGSYTEMWMRRCSPCPVCGMRPAHSPTKGGNGHRIRCGHMGSDVFGVEPVSVEADSIMSAVSDWNVRAGRGLVMYGRGRSNG